jgi:hypothetical protein
MIVWTLSLAVAKSLPPPDAADDPIPLDGEPVKLEAVEDHKYLHYAVGRSIDAPPTVVWAVLTDAGAYTSWNSTVVSLEGPIQPGERIELVVKVAPKRTFKLDVSTFDPPRLMVWEDGGKSFRGVRTFVLEDNGAGGTAFTMKEAFTGSMMKMIAPKLPDFGPDFEQFAKDLEAESERRASL